MDKYKGKRVFDQRWLFTLTKYVLFKPKTLNGFAGLGIVQVNPDLSEYWRKRIIRHEWLHVYRQETYFKANPNLLWKLAGHVAWRWKYLTSKSFRIEEEKLADAAEVATPIQINLKK